MEWYFSQASVVFYTNEGKQNFITVFIIITMFIIIIIICLGLYSLHMAF